MMMVDRRRLLQLQKIRAGLLARKSFVHFLVTTDSQYQVQWFHRLIAQKCEALLNGEIKNLMVFIPPQHGKLLPSDAKVLTTKGWVRHGDLRAGDYVFGQDGKPKRVLANSGTYRWLVTNLEFQGGYRIQSAREHLWRLNVDYDDHKGRREVVLETQNIYKRRHRRSPYIDCSPCLDLPERDLPIDPYLLGIWLGDGTVGTGTITEGAEDRDYFSTFGVCKKLRSGCYSIRIEGLCRQLRLNGLLHNKHIPLEYLLSSREQREALLCGLMDTDGTVDRRGNCEFTQKSGRLAEDVYILLRSLGYKARKSYSAMKIYGRVVGERTRILFNPDRGDVVFRLPRKRDRLLNKTLQDREDKRKFFLKSITGLEECLGNCIEVEGGMYLAGEDLIPTHNSSIISKAFPAWALGTNPDLRIVGASYSADLSEQFSRAIQRTMEEEVYKQLYPETVLGGGSDGKGYIKNVSIFEIVGHRGFYKAVGVGGSLTGTPVDIAIIDDPIKDAMEAQSETYRERVWQWYNTVLTTRLHNNSRQLFIMTRWHEDDLAGRILRTEGDEWEVLRIPALCEVEGDGGLSTRRVGEALWEGRHSKEKLLKQRARSPRAFAALYQQSPSVEDGTFVKREWFEVVSYTDFHHDFKQEDAVMHFYLDTAYKKQQAGRDNDPSGIIAACWLHNRLYIFGAAKVYMEMPELLKFLPTFVKNNLGSTRSMLKVEPKANGLSVIQMLREVSTLNVVPTEVPSDSKELRFRSVTPRIEAGKVRLVQGDWNEEFLNELLRFPNGLHDEYVDILGYAINDLYRDDDVDWEGLGKGFLGL